MIASAISPQSAETANAAESEIPALVVKINHETAPSKAPLTAPSASSPPSDETLFWVARNNKVATMGRCEVQRLVQAGTEINVMRKDQVGGCVLPAQFGFKGDAVLTTPPAPKPAPAPLAAPVIFRDQTAGGGSTADELADQIRQAVDKVLKLDTACRDFGKFAINHAIKAGKLMADCKKKVGHGKWEKWLSDSVPQVSQETACRWIRMAKMSGVTDLTAAETLTDAYRLCGILPPLESEKPPKRTPTSAAKLSPMDAVMRTSTTLQKGLRLLVQKGGQISESQRTQFKLLKQEIDTLFDKLLGVKPK